MCGKDPLWIVDEGQEMTVVPVERTADDLAELQTGRAQNFLRRLPVVKTRAAALVAPMIAPSVFSSVVSCCLPETY